MAVTLYGDESESQDPSVFTLAGFIASTITGWKDFIPAWREMLSTIGPYPVDAFHANVIDKGEPPFDGWRSAEREALTTRAVDILADTTISANLYAIGCTFVLDDLNAMLPGVMGRGRTQDIYERCYRVLFFNMLKFSPFMGVDLILDRKKKAEGLVQAHFDAAKMALDRDPETYGVLNECVFQDDRIALPLQAADLLAFELRRRAWDRTRDKSIPIRPTYQRLKDVFQITSPAAKPPYRQRLFRCYDERFVALLKDVLERDEYQPITEDDVIHLWYHMDAPED